MAAIMQYLPICERKSVIYGWQFLSDYITLINGVDNWKQKITGMHCFPTMATIIQEGHPPPSDIWNLYFYVSSINDT